MFGFGVSLKQLVGCWSHLKNTCRRECTRCLIQLSVPGWCWLPCNEHDRVYHLCIMPWSFGTSPYKHPLGHLALHSWAYMHHTGSQENEVGPEEPEEIHEQEPPEAQEPGEELQECPDHRPSTFEKGKPRSILSLPILANLQDILCLIYYIAFKW